MSQNDPKTTSLMTSVTKNPKPPKLSFECRLEDCPIPLEPLNSSLAQSTEELRHW